MTVFSANAAFTASSTINLVNLDELRGMFDDAGLRVANVPLAREVLERVLDGGPAR